MKHVLAGVCCLLMTVSLISCKKDKECPAPPPDPVRIAGNWLGKYSTSDASAPTINQFWEIKANGEIVVHDGFTTPTAPDANKAIGTWTLNGNTFRCTYKFLTLDVNRTVQCTLSGEDKKLTGFRGANGGITGNGQVAMDKQ